MSKYIDADKIRSEVERIQETGCESPISVCNDILSFIDFLQQEQPSLPDLDEAARDIVIKMHPCLKDCTILGDRLTRGQLMALVKAGAEWAMHYQEKKIADAYEKGKQEGIRVVRSWESSPGQCGY